MKLDIAEIETFLRVAELGSVSLAAQQLGVAKSVVSKRLSDLERHLGARLLFRSTRKVAPTDSGQRFYRQARAALEELRAAAEAVASEDGSLAGSLRILAPISFGTLWLAPQLTSFMRLHPQLEVALQLDDRVSDFEREGYDLCLRISRLHDRALIARRLGSSPRVVCCSPDYIRAHGAPERLEQLLEHPCIGYCNLSAEQLWSFDDPAAPQRPLTLAPGGRFTSNNGEAMRDAALAGLGLAVLPRFIVQPDLQAGRLLQVLPEARPTADEIHALYPRSHRASVKIQALCDFLQQALHAAAWTTDGAR
jgi:DNA-binding transcriptional LysR family regulator